MFLDALDKVLSTEKCPFVGLFFFSVREESEIKKIRQVQNQVLSYSDIWWDRIIMKEGSGIAL